MVNRRYGIVFDDLVDVGEIAIGVIEQSLVSQASAGRHIARQPHANAHDAVALNRAMRQDSYTPAFLEQNAAACFQRWIAPAFLRTFSASC